MGSVHGSGGAADALSWGQTTPVLEALARSASMMTNNNGKRRLGQWSSQKACSKACSHSLHFEFWKSVFHLRITDVNTTIEHGNLPRGELSHPPLSPHLCSSRSRLTQLRRRCLPYRRVLADAHWSGWLCICFFSLHDQRRVVSCCCPASRFHR